MSWILNEHCGFCCHFGLNFKPSNSHLSCTPCHPPPPPKTDTHAYTNPVLRTPSLPHPQHTNVHTQVTFAPGNLIFTNSWVKRSSMVCFEVPPKLWVYSEKQGTHPSTIQSHPNQDIKDDQNLSPLWKWKTTAKYYLSLTTHWRFSKAFQ